MLLKLQNFKCWEKQNFDLQEDGVILISGKSGKGKTSILDAIYFTLFGKGKKVITHGHKHGSVSLQYKNLNITRTKGPNRLVLIKDGLEYEDDAAQAIIYQDFGSFFNIVSYMQQNSVKSFLLLSPLAKLEFLETLAFQNIDIIKIKQKVKILLQKRNNNMIANQSQLKLLCKIYDDKISKLVEVVFPLKGSNKEHLEKNEHIRLSNCTIKINKLHRKIQLLHKRLSDTKVLNTFLQYFNEQFDKLTAKQEVYESTSNVDSSAQILILQELLHNIKIYEKGSTYSKRLKVIGQVWKDYNKTDCKQLIQDYEQYIKDIIQVEKLTEKLKLYPVIENYEEMKLELQLGKKLICPSCKTNLHYDSKHECLIIGTTSIKNSIDLEEAIKAYEKRSSILEQIHSIKTSYEEFTCNDKPEIRNELNILKKYYEQNIGLDYEKRQLKYKLDKLPSCTVSDKKEDEIQAELCTLEVQTRLYKENIKNLHEVQRELKRLQVNKKQKMEEYLTNYEKQVSTDKIEKRITDYLKLIQQCEIDREKHSKNIEKITVYNRYMNDKKECLIMGDKIKSLEVLDKQLRDRLAASLLLKSKIKEAESIAISNIIHSINIFAKNYLQYFFPDNPINVTITPFKNSKKVKKPQINIYIEYKGMECDMGILSGGELQRVVLAFTLALAEMYHTPFLLLDECTSNLGQELTNTIIQGIKKHYSGKLVIMIAHQVVSGLFDHIIEI